MFTHLRLRGFKSWEDTGELHLRPITGIFGTNSSGKTSLLQALLLLKQTADASDRSQSFHFGDTKTAVDLGDFRSVVHGHDPSGTVEIEISWEAQKPFKVTDSKSSNASVVVSSNELAFRTRVSQMTDGQVARVTVDEMRYGVGSSAFGMRRKPEDKLNYEIFADATEFDFVRTVGRKWPLPKPVKCYGFPDQARAYFQNAGFVADLQLALEERLSNLYYLGPLRAYPARRYTWTGAQPIDMGPAGESVVDAMLSSRERGDKISLGPGKKRPTIEEYVARWLKRLGLIHDFRVQPLAKGSPVFEVKVRKSAGAAEALITDVGFGVSQILPVIVLCFYAPEGATVILEQPEIHLHPAVQAGLADVLIDASKRRNVQILLESHSEHLLRRLQRRVAEEEVVKDDIGLFFCTNDEHGSNLTNLKMDLFGNIENWPQDFFGDQFSEIAAMSMAGLRRKQDGDA